MRIRATRPLLLLAMAFAASAFAANPGALGVYGPDDRQDLYQVKDPRVRRLADSSVALFKFWDLGLPFQGEIPVSFASSLGKSENLCDGQRFEDQLTSPYCSGALVAPDIVLTAGHCVKNFLVCLGIRVAFGFSVRSPGVMPDKLASSDVYRCKEIIHSQDAEGQPDFALIRLDRPVTGHVPLELDAIAAQHVGDPVFVIGYPSGLPLKVAANARIRQVDATDFVANLDTFDRSSGSPVFNATTGLIEGVLVEGDDDYVQAPGKSCNVVKRCPDDGCLGETSTSVSAIAAYLPHEN